MAQGCKPQLIGYEQLSHKGASVNWSDGCCIVIFEDKLIEIWNTINPKDTANVTINITDD